MLDNSRNTDTFARWAFAHHGDQARFFINSNFICRQQQTAVRDKHRPVSACSIVVRTIIRIGIIANVTARCAESNEVDNV